MSNKNFLDGLPLLIECLDIPDDIKDKIWEVYHRYENETNPQKQADALIRIQSLIRRADKNNPPMDLSTAASFFISATGKPMNLATAQYQEVDPDIKFKDQKKILDHNFVEAVEILQECGFVNTMITSSRKRQKNKTDF